MISVVSLQFVLLFESSVNVNFELRTLNFKL